MASGGQRAGADVGPGRGGRTRLALFHPEGGTAELYAHGAQLLRWTHPTFGEVLFVSARDDRHQESHGGVPVLFPRFGRDPEGRLPQHGFARDVEWAIGERHVDDAGRSTGTMTLRSTPETRARWPHDFRLELVVVLGGSLTLTLRATNPGPGPFAFTGGLHSYLRVADLRGTSIRGLGGVAYHDRRTGSEEHVQTEASLVIGEELDRIYLRSPSPILVADGDRTIRVENRGWENVVVWNPGPAGDARYDFAPGEWTRFVCVEGATVRTPITLRAGQRWSAAQTLSVEGTGDER